MHFSNLTANRKVLQLSKRKPSILQLLKWISCNDVLFRFAMLISQFSSRHSENIKLDKSHPEKLHCLNVQRSNSFPSIPVSEKSRLLNDWFSKKPVLIFSLFFARYKYFKTVKIDLFMLICNFFRVNDFVCVLKRFPSNKLKRTFYTSKIFCKNHFCCPAPNRVMIGRNGCNSIFQNFFYRIIVICYNANVFS